MSQDQCRQADDIPAMQTYFHSKDSGLQEGGIGFEVKLTNLEDEECERPLEMTYNMCGAALRVPVDEWWMLCIRGH